MAARSVRVYGVKCSLCGELMLRGPDDEAVCAGCAGDLEHA